MGVLSSMVCRWSSLKRACTCRSSQENGGFAGSFWLCAQCAKALSPLSALLVTPELTGTVSALYEETVARLESSLQTVCADFQPDPYAKVFIYHPKLLPYQHEVLRPLQMHSALTEGFASV